MGQFLALFGRSARATGMEDERSNKVMPAQWLHLLNSTQVRRKIEQGPRLQAILPPDGRTSRDDGMARITPDRVLDALRPHLDAIPRTGPLAEVPAAHAALVTATQRLADVLDGLRAALCDQFDLPPAPAVEPANATK